jgi:hypothetical protein
MNGSLHYLIICRQLTLNLLSQHKTINKKATKENFGGFLSWVEK